MKEMYLIMKGWEKLNGSVCIGCGRDKKISNYVLINNYLSMDIAPHWPMCVDHAFRASQPGWRQSYHYNGSNW
jgi:hypothetical protein